ncbi:hypothetical protein L3Q82_023544, partial [Scortum barcoo]
ADESHTVDIQSLKSEEDDTPTKEKEEENEKEDEEEEEEEEETTQTALNSAPVTKLQPFPKEWYSQGRFLTANAEDQLQTPASSQPAVREDDRTGSIYIQDKGTVMTYMFEDPEEVISVYLAMFGEILLQAPPSGDHNYADLNSFRALLERDRVIEDLRQNLQTKEKEVDSLFQRNSYLAREVLYLSEVVQHLNQKLAELEADQQEAREKIRSLLSRRAPAVLPTKTVTKPTMDPDQLRQVSRLTRELNVSNKQLRSTVRQALTDMKNQLEQLRGAVGKLAQVEREAQELRSLYRKEAVKRKSLYNKLLELQGNIRVFCRCRKSSAASSCLEKSDEQELVVVQKGSRKKFQFDKVFPQSSTQRFLYNIFSIFLPSFLQEEVFAGTLPVITSCVDGYNVCILAYGQTGSGKTYTMMGSKENPGVNIRSIRELLHICAEKEKVSYSLKISMLEIYNDNLNDLLTKSPGAALDIRVQGKSVTVPGLTQIQVQTEADILNIMETGEKNRKIASTKMNTQRYICNAIAARNMTDGVDIPELDHSRSHLVVALEVEGSDEVSGLTSLYFLCLLSSGSISRVKGRCSLQVFSALKCNALHVPFRNSKLTHLLQPCLSRDAKCCVFVNVSPDIKDVVETLSTLKFSSTIRQVLLGKATQNIVPTKNNKTVKQSCKNISSEF